VIAFDNDGTAELRHRLRSVEAQAERLEGLVLLMAGGIRQDEMPLVYRRLLATITGADL
jgi:hypothetical protein